jgi:hypothetical protein
MGGRILDERGVGDHDEIRTDNHASLANRLLDDAYEHRCRRTAALSSISSASTAPDNLRETPRCLRSDSWSSRLAHLDHGTNG